jgi:hypothetical protein
MLPHIGDVAIQIALLVNTRLVARTAQDEEILVWVVPWLPAAVVADVVDMQLNGIGPAGGATPTRPFENVQPTLLPLREAELLLVRCERHDSTKREETPNETKLSDRHRRRALLELKLF